MRKLKRKFQLFAEAVGSPTTGFIKQGSIDIGVLLEHFSIDDVKVGEIGYVEIPAVTLVFDLAGSSVSIRNNGPHAFVDRFGEVFRELSNLIYRFNGIIEKFPGDGISAHFLKRDDEADLLSASRRAVRAAEHMRHLMEDKGYRGQFRISMWTGKDTIAAVFGSEHHHEVISIGDGVNIAHKLEKFVKSRGYVIGMDDTVATQYKFEVGKVSVQEKDLILGDGSYTTWHGVK